MLGVGDILVAARAGVNGLQRLFAGNAQSCHSNNNAGRSTCLADRGWAMIATFTAGYCDGSIPYMRALWCIGGV